LQNDTEEANKKYGKYLVSKATSFCETNAEELELNVPPPKIETEDVEAVNASAEAEVFDLKKSYAFQRCVETLSNYLLQKATEDLLERITPPSKMAFEHMKLNDLNVTALASKPLLVDVSFVVYTIMYPMFYILIIYSLFY